MYSRTVLGLNTEVSDFLMHGELHDEFSERPNGDRLECFVGLFFEFSELEIKFENVWIRAGDFLFFLITEYSKLDFDFITKFIGLPESFVLFVNFDLIDWITWTMSKLKKMLLMIKISCKTPINTKIATNIPRKKSEIL